MLAAPLGAGAQTSAPAQATSARASTPSSSASAPAQSGDDRETAFLHSSTVKALARLLHLNLDTTVDILLVINFAVIFFAIAIPLTRYMPRIVRKRSQSLRHDLEAARRATEDARARLSAVEAKLAGLGEEMRIFRDQVEQESGEDEKRIKAALGEETARVVAAAEQEIGVAITQAKRSLREFAANLAIDQASRQIKLNDETDRALIAEIVAGVSPDVSTQGGVR